MGKISEKQLLYLFFSSFVLLQIYFLLFSESAYGYGGADNIAHYQIAKYAFRYPELFLDLWGKPVYTTLLAPFALISYKVAKAFNLIVAVITLMLSAKIAKKLFPGSSLITIVLIAFAPVYFLLAISCLTEVLFSLVLVAAVYLFIKNRFILSAVILSFIPFVRSEGFVLFPVFALAFFLQRSYRSIPFLAVGAVFYSIIGYFVLGDILWIINKQPYSLGESIYGSGSLFHFVKNSNTIFGIPLLILIVAGLIYWGYDLIKNFSLRSQNTILFILIAGSWIIFFAAHSYVWWKGTGGSLGLLRVIGGVLPLAAITGMKIFWVISERVKNRNITFGIFTVFALAQIVLLFTQNNLLLKADPTEQLVKKSADFIRVNEEGKKVFYFNPLLIHYLDINPYDITKCNWWVADKQQPSNTLEWGDLLVWDAHFGPNEGGVKLENLENDPYLKKIKSFYPVEKIVVLGGYDYSIQVFEKTKTKVNVEPASETIIKTLDFNQNNNDHIIEFGGTKVWKMDETQEYANAVVVNVNELLQKDILNFELSVDYYGLEEIKADEVLLVLSIENEGKHLRYEKIDFIASKEEWKKGKIESRVSATLPPTAIISVYIWNKDRKQFLFKNLQLSISSS
jgi:hypothetical protein